MTTDEIRQILDAIDRGEKLEMYDELDCWWYAVTNPTLEFPQFRIADPRYPYTYAADYLREKVNVPVSRGEMSLLLAYVAAVIDMPDEELAKKLADKYLETLK